MSEEKVDRRLHWAQIIVAGLVAAVVWCVRLEFTVNGLKSDMEIQKKSRDEMISKLWDKLGADHDRINETRTVVDCMRLKNCQP